MSRRARRLAQHHGMDLGGLDKRQQRRAVRRAGTRSHVLLRRRVGRAQTLAEATELVGALVDAGYGSIEEAVALLERALQQPIEPAPAPTTPPPAGLLLDSLSLFSKKGFGAGFVPEEWLEYCDAHRVSYATPHEWNRVLARLVWRRLLPALPAHVEVDLHDVRVTNPVRARRVDGNPVTWGPGEKADGHFFESVMVWVPWSDVAAELELVRA